MSKTVGQWLVVHHEHCDCAFIVLTWADDFTTMLYGGKIEAILNV